MTDQSLAGSAVPLTPRAAALPRPGATAGWIGLTGGVLAAALVLSLDAVLGGQLLRGRELRTATISEYVFTSGGWAFNTAVLALAIGSGVLLVGLIRARLVRPVSPGSILMSLWVIGLIGIVAFPKHNWAYGPSTSGTVHRVASLLAFLSLPFAVLAIARWRRHAESAAARAAFWLAIGSLACVGILVGAIAVAAVGDLSWWRIIPLGLVERGIAGFGVAAVVALAIWLIRERVTALRQPPVGPAAGQARSAMNNVANSMAGSSSVAFAEKNSGPGSATANS